MRTAWESLGWSVLTPTEQRIGLSGALIGLGAWATLTTTLRALFGGLQLRRRKRRKAKSKRRRRRR
jgi:hypothetical protein